MKMVSRYNNNVYTILFGVLYVVTVLACDSKDHHGKEFMVQIKEEGLSLIKTKSERFGLKFRHKIVSNIYLFEADNASLSPEMLQNIYKRFRGKILAIEPREYAKLRYLGDTPAPIDFKKWILTRRPKVNIRYNWPYYGMDIQEAWSMGCTGKDIVVAVVDTGIELDHKDLKKNINLTMSRSFVEGDTGDAGPSRLMFYREFDKYASHGTMAAGLIASEFGNGNCSAGVAFNATLVSLKVFMLDEKKNVWSRDITFPEDYISQALEYHRDHIDIYSCSFNLDSMFSNSTIHIKTVLSEGVQQGRKGKGNIFVFSAGDNRGDVYDCNTLSYTNSIYTITISSVGKGGTRPEYSIPCSCILAATYGEYRTFAGNLKLETSSLDGSCDTFMGTSASAAIASGIIAQILQANSSLTWRDVQYIIVITSSLHRITYKKKTSANAIGLQYSPYFGFGIMNATAAVIQALSWKTVPEQLHHTVSVTAVQNSFRKNDFTSVTVKFPYCEMALDCLRFVEHVSVNMKYSIQKNLEQRLEISLCSPLNTCSILLHKKLDREEQRKEMCVKHRNWNFTSVQFWGEHPFGDWNLIIKIHKVQQKTSDYKTNFQFESITVTFFGTATNPFPEKFVKRDVSKKISKTKAYITERDQYFSILLYYAYYMPNMIVYFVILLASLMVLV